LEVDKLSTEAFDLKITTVLDINGRMGDDLTWGMANFFIQNIAGILQLYKNTGLGFEANYCECKNKEQKLTPHTEALVYPQKGSKDIANNYKLKITGIGFGTNSDKSETKTKRILINNTEVDPRMFSESKVAAYQSEIIISKEVVNKL